jgi:hypothetical protein
LPASSYAGSGVKVGTKSSEISQFVSVNKLIFTSYSQTVVIE